MVSIPAIKLPVAQLTKLIRSYYHEPTTTNTNTNTTQQHPFIVVDGAHAWGQISNKEISLLLQDYIDDDRTNNNQNNKSKNPARYWIDAYVSNGHKWMYSPKGSAIMWIHKSRITPVFPEPTVISSENFVSFDNDDDPMYSRYIYTSTKDYTSILSIKKAMEFRQQVLGGDTTIYKYIRGLALQAKQYLQELWNTPTLTPSSMEEFMINVILPINHTREDKRDVATSLQRWLYTTKDMYVVIAEEPSSGYIYTRLSSQIYLLMEDFQLLGEAVLDFLREYDKSIKHTTIKID
jgi:hypothetical protein